MTSRRTDHKPHGYTVHPTTPPTGECGCGAPAVATVEGDLPACVQCAADCAAYGADVTYHAAPIPRRPECADGCPLTDTSGCATGCVRAGRPEPLTVTLTTTVTNGGHVGTEPTPALEPSAAPAPAPDPPFHWAPYLALLAVIIAAAVCAAAGWTR
jgi:hypothetical protein